MAFPTNTTTLDNFNRSESPLSTNWAGPAKPGRGQLRCTGTQALTVSGTESDSYRTDLGVIDDVEIWATVSAADGAGFWYAMFVGHDLSDVWYEFSFSVSDGWAGLYRYYNGGASYETMATGSLGTIANGNTVGMKVTNGAFQVFKNGSQIGATVYDSRYQGGYVGLSAYGNNPRWDNFGGGAPATSGVEVISAGGRDGQRRNRRRNDGLVKPMRGRSYDLKVCAGSALEYELETFIEPFGWDQARITLDITETATAVDTAVSLCEDYGVKPLIVVYLDEDTMPTQQQVEDLADWAEVCEDRVVAFELGNEDCASYKGNHVNGATYATRVTQAHAAIAGRVPLWIQATQYGTWLDDMAGSVASIENYCEGWTIHPYDDDYEAAFKGEMMALDALGWYRRPINVTEFGLASDNGATLDDNYGWPVDQTYAQAATALDTVWDHAYAIRRIHSFWLYMAHDLYAPGANNSRENYFGAVKLDGTAKGAYTTKVQELAGL